MLWRRIGRVEGPEVWHCAQCKWHTFLMEIQLTCGMRLKEIGMIAGCCKSEQ
jgi:hypothetical protein